jgi:ABC-type multidrug transport system fused ATPase/permease subunit
LVGLYKPTKGKIFFNNISSVKIHYNAFRKELGFVTQDTQLFAGTIRDNLLFVQPNATDEEIKEALRKAAFTDVLKHSILGIYTRLGESGMKLSGGERQRLSIARALIRNPRLLIFDEATSALDSITEESITETIRGLSSSNERITILIAHRLLNVGVNLVFEHITFIQTAAPKRTRHVQLLIFTVFLNRHFADFFQLFTLFFIYCPALGVFADCPFIGRRFKKSGSAGAH